MDISKHNPSKIIVAGDWHRNPYATFPKRVIRLAKSMGIKTILHVGDFGYNFNAKDAYAFEKPLHLALLAAKVNLVWIDGNHENHEMLQSLPRQANGFAQTGARGNIFYAPRGHRWTWSGKTFGALGGAWSPNWRSLKEGTTLFKDLEETTEDDLLRLGEDKLDYLITHDIPESISLKSYYGDLIDNQTRPILERAVKATKPTRMFSGHWHQRANFTIDHDDGAVTLGHILDKEWTFGNILILDLITNEIKPPSALWSEIHYEGAT